MIFNLFNPLIFFLLAVILLLKSCDLLKEKQYPEVLRIGNAQSQSNYVFENTENNIYYSSEYAHGKDSHGIDIVSVIEVPFNSAGQAPGPTNILKDSFVARIKYFVENPLIPRTEKTKYKNKDSDRHLFPSEYFKLKLCETPYCAGLLRCFSACC